MISFMKRLWKDRRGNALVIAAGALPLLIGSAGLATDTIQWALWKRQLQRAADSAAEAGVYAKIQEADATAAINKDLGYNSHILHAYSVDPHVPPTSGAYQSDPFAVQVKLSVQKTLGFSSLFMTAAPVITASSTATIVPSGKYCVVSLENTATTGINATGATNVNLGCGMITNSTSLSAAVATGSSSVYASPIAAVGGIPASTHWATGTVLQPFTIEQEDPFGKVDPPAVPSGCNTVGNIKNNDPPVSYTNACFKSLSIDGEVTFAGNIIVDGGSISIGTQAKVTCNECTFFLTNSSSSQTASIGNFEITGSPNLNFISPKSGTYKGLLVYQDRRAQDTASANFQDKLRGSSTSYFEGAFYFPRQELEFEGNTGMNTNCLQLVARRVKFSGNSNIQNSCATGSGGMSFDGKRVRLVE